LAWQPSTNPLAVQAYFDFLPDLGHQPLGTPAFNRIDLNDVNMVLGVPNEPLARRRKNPHDTTTWMLGMLGPNIPLEARLVVESEVNEAIISPTKWQRWDQVVVGFGMTHVTIAQ